jgi:hypothetical protein
LTNSHSVKSQQHKTIKQLKASNAKTGSHEFPEFLLEKFRNFGTWEKTEFPELQSLNLWHFSIIYDYVSGLFLCSRQSIVTTFQINMLCRHTIWCMHDFIFSGKLPFSSPNFKKDDKHALEWRKKAVFTTNDLI